ncbi:hypothetical protein VNI00_006776 [Paramarasmius palmivorus]|uniref:Uncharacterized protein n=1 Tax=Paramarasmius palmivorus TaxID=297713 RepID=A0AAW0D9Q4_9AGAR
MDRRTHQVGPHEFFAQPSVPVTTRPGDINLRTGTSLVDDAVQNYENSSQPHSENPNHPIPPASNVNLEDLVLTVAQQRSFIRCLFATLQMLKMQKYLVQMEKEELQKEVKDLVTRNTVLERLHGLSSDA